MNLVRSMLVVRPSSRNSVTPSESLNPKYKPLRFGDTESVYLIGRVMGILDPNQIATAEDVDKYQLLHPESM